MNYWIIHIEHTFCICPFLVAFFSATIDGRNLIFGHKLHIGTPYHGKRFFDLSDSYFLFADFVDFYTHLTYISICTFFVTFFSATIDDRDLIFGHKCHIGTTGSSNPMGSKTLPTIWGTYMKLVTKYQISAINSCWEEKWDFVDFYTHLTYISICTFFVAFFSATIDDRNLVTSFI
jgi:hypothetical protein